jgi:hypothetical protein
MRKINYFLATVIIPLFLGISLYVLNAQGLSLYFIRNYLPDGLWAFSFTSAILMIWGGKINRFWITAILFIFPAFELLQLTQIINGVADFKDVICYYLFAALAFFIYKQTFKIPNYEQKP